MFNNWNVYRKGTGALVVDKLSEDDARWVVSSNPAEYYASNPNGATIPNGLHDDGDFDPAFGDLNG